VAPLQAVGLPRFEVLVLRDVTGDATRRHQR
jgi:hypothetical protein